MASEATEVLRYQLDLADVEAKAARMQALLANIGKARAAGEDTSQLENELARTVAGFEKLAGGQKKAGDEAIDFDRKAEKLVKGSLGALSPQLAQAADFALDLVQGVNKLSVGLLAVAAGGAAIGVVTVAIQEIARRAEEAERSFARLGDAAQAAREKAAGERQALGEKALAAGVIDDPDVLMGVRSAIGERAAFRGMDAEFLDTLTIANERGKLTPEQLVDFARGVAVSGGKFTFKGDESDVATIARAMEAGRGEAGVSALRQLQRGQRPASFEEALDAELRRIEDTGKYSPEVMRIIRNAARRGDGTVEGLALRHGSFWQKANVLYPAESFNLGEGATVGEVSQEIEGARQRAARAMPTALDPRATPTTINVNIGTQINPPSKRGVASDFGVAQRSTFGGH